MTRWIDADKLLEELRESCKRHAENGREFSLLQRNIRIVHEQPTIDAEPVKHGEWIDDGQYSDNFPHHEWRCSECGEHVIEIDTPWFKYCPNCGADMRGEEEWTK